MRSQFPQCVGEKCKTYWLLVWDNILLERSFKCAAWSRPRLLGEHRDRGLWQRNLLGASSSRPETHNCYALTPAERKPRVFLVDRVSVSKLFVFLHKAHLIICWLCLAGWRLWKFWGALDLRLLTGGPFLKTGGLLRLSGLLGTLRKLEEEVLVCCLVEEKVLLLEKVEPVSCLLVSLRPPRGGTRFTPGGRTIWMSNVLEIKFMKDWISNLELKDIQCESSTQFWEQFEQRMELFREKCSKNESQNKSFLSSNYHIRGTMTWQCVHL